MSKVIDNWTFEQGEFENHAYRPGEDLYLDGDFMDVFLSRLNAAIRTDVVIKLLEHAGYDVTKKPKA